MDVQRLLKCELSDEEKGVLYVRLWGCKDKTQLFGLPDNVLNFALKTLAAEDSTPALPPDRDEEWVNAVCKPLNQPPLTLRDLREAMEAPLLERLPVTWKRYGDLQGAYGNEAAQKLFSTPDQYRAEDISSLVSLVLMTSSESVYELCFMQLWNLCMSKLRTVAIIDASRNEHHISSSTMERFQPNLLLWAHKRLVFKTEHRKGQDEIGDAWADLANKMDQLDASFYGPVEWMLGLATAGGLFRLGAFKKGGNPEFLSPLLHSGRIDDRFELVRWSINLVRVARSWAPIVQDVVMAKPYHVFPTVAYGCGDQIRRSVVVANGIVTKTIWPWELHEDDGFTTFEYVKLAYAIGDPHLIGGNVKLSTSGRYSVEMKVVGFRRHPRGAKEIVEAVQHILLALKALHAAGLVHRDIKWKNVLYVERDEAWVVIDLETVWVEGQVPSCWLQVWDQDTLVNGRYTAASDLYLLGKLLEGEFRPSLSRQGRDFVRKLKSGGYCSAAEALCDVNAWKSLEEMNKSVN